MYDAAQQELKDLFKTTKYLASARFIERSDALYDKLRGTGEWYSPGARVAYRACLEQTLTITARVPEASDQHAVCADAVPRSRSCRLRRRCSSFLLAACSNTAAHGPASGLEPNGISPFWMVKTQYPNGLGSGARAPLGHNSA